MTFGTGALLFESRRDEEPDMPFHLGKLELRDDHNHPVGYTVVTTNGAVGCRVDTLSLVTFENLVPAGNLALESLLNAELGTLREGTEVDERRCPELWHVLAEAFSHRRLHPVVRNLQSFDQRPNPNTLSGRHLEPWFATGNPDKLQPGEPELNADSYNHLRRHGNDRFASIRYDREKHAWTNWVGSANEVRTFSGEWRSMFDAQRDADLRAHLGCDGASCGRWWPGGVFEWSGRIG